MTAKIEYTNEQIEAMRDMRRKGKSYNEIGKAFGCSSTTAAVNLGVKRRPTGTLRVRRTLPRGMRLAALNLGEPNRVFVPEEVTADRDRRLAIRRDLTAEFFGDPPRGYSALDRRQEIVS